MTDAMNNFLKFREGLQQEQQPSKMNIFDKIGTVLTHTAVGLSDPKSLMTINKAKAAQDNSTLNNIIMMRALGIDPMGMQGQMGGGIQGQPVQLDENTKRQMQEQAMQSSGIPKANYGVTKVVQDGVTVGQTPESTKEMNIAEDVAKRNIRTVEEHRQDLGRMESAIGTTLDSWIENAKWNYDTYGVEPGGIIGGLTSKISGKLRENPYWEAFSGSLLEYGAQNARISMPGTRAFRAIEFFQKTGPSDFSTVQSGVNNIAATIRSGIGKDIAIAPNEYATDEFLGSDFMSLPPNEKFDRKQEYLNNVAEGYKKSVYSAFYNKAPELVEESIIKKYDLDGSKVSALGLDSNEWEIINEQ